MKILLLIIIAVLLAIYAPALLVLCVSVLVLAQLHSAKNDKINWNGPNNWNK